MIHSFLVAVAFLTILPIPFRDLPSAGEVARSRVWYPVVGLCLGLLLGILCGVATAFWPWPVAAFVLLAVWVGITGALHLDGFADLCDGLFGGNTPHERLTIMKDPRHGSFGVVGIGLVMLGKFAALASLMEGPSAYRTAWAVAAAVAWGRAMVLIMAASAPYPRSEGTGKASVRATRWPEAVAFAAVTGGLLILMHPRPDFAVSGLALLCGFWIVLGLRRICEKLLGGVTGDCLGASIELTEVVVMVIAALRSQAGAP
jgi:adenosylcobinamide-GDP ribazoletransferase